MVLLQLYHEADFTVVYHHFRNLQCACRYTVFNKL